VTKTNEVVHESTNYRTRLPSKSRHGDGGGELSGNGSRSRGKGDMKNQQVRKNPLGGKTKPRSGKRGNHPRKLPFTFEESRNWVGWSAKKKRVAAAHTKTNKVEKGEGLFVPASGFYYLNHEKEEQGGCKGFNSGGIRPEPPKPRRPCAYTRTWTYISTENALGLKLIHQRLSVGLE